MDEGKHRHTTKTEAEDSYQDLPQLGHSRKATFVLTKNFIKMKKLTKQYPIIIVLEHFFSLCL